MNSFFEGEIIDFRRHSLETENFRSDGLETDVAYWRNIGPFKELSRQILKAEGAEEGQAEEELARCLGSRDWLENRLGRGWILMRWKGKLCSLHPAPGQCSETNGGWPFSYRAMFYRSI